MASLIFVFLTAFVKNTNLNAFVLLYIYNAVTLLNVAKISKI